MSHRSSSSTAKIHVVAPAGPVPAQKLQVGMKAVARHDDVRWEIAPNIDQHEGYFAGDDGARLAGLTNALRDGDARAVWCARGGYGSTRLLADLDRAVPPVAAQPEPDNQATSRMPFLVGFSDVTALLCWAWTQHQMPGIHGPVLTQFGGLHPEDQGRVWDAINGAPPPPLEVSGSTSCVSLGGTVEGRLIVGNLEVLRSLLGTPYMPSLEGCILALEEIGERPYRIDRALTHLRAAGALRGVRGVALGQFTGCEEPEGTLSAGARAMEVAHERLEQLQVPVVSGFPFGHDPARNAALIFGGMVRLEAEHGTLLALEGIDDAIRSVRASGSSIASGL